MIFDATKNTYNKRGRIRQIALDKWCRPKDPADEGLAVSAPEAAGYDFQSSGVVEMLEKLQDKLNETTHNKDNTYKSTTRNSNTINIHNTSKHNKQISCRTSSLSRVMTNESDREKAK